MIPAGQSVPMISFERRFQVWMYTVSHAQMLLRANQSNEATTRIDVLFRGVAALELPTLFQGLTIAEVSWDEAPSLGVQIGSWTTTGKKLFAIHGANFAGYVAASGVFWHEDSGSFDDPSHFEDSFAASVRVDLHSTQAPPVRADSRRTWAGRAFEAAVSRLARIGKTKPTGKAQ